MFALKSLLATLYFSLRIVALDFLLFAFLGVVLGVFFGALGLWFFLVLMAWTLIRVTLRLPTTYTEAQQWLAFTPDREPEHLPSEADDYGFTTTDRGDQ